MGHSKWDKTKRQKAVTDAKTSKIFSKLVRFIATEAKLSGGKESPGLRAAIEKAKKVNMPSENIERAIKKASEPGANMEMNTYETYGPGGVAIIIETLTDSKNRTAQDIKHILSENNCELGAIGSSAWAFKKEITPEGIIWNPTTSVSPLNEDLELLEKLVDDLEDNDDVQDVYTNAE